MRTFSHVGIPVKEKKPNAGYNEGMSVWIADYNESINKIEFLTFEEGSILPALVQNIAHLAYEVPNLEEALAGKNVIFPPYVCSDSLTIAFIVEEGIAIEFMEVKKTKTG